MHPATRDLWKIIIEEARENPLENCGNRSLRLALVAKSLEDCARILIVQFLPQNSERLELSKRKISWITHYATIIGKMIYDATMETPIEEELYLEKAFPKQKVKVHYYMPDAETVFKPENAIESGKA